MKGTGEYNPDFKQKALALKERWLWRCERCGHAHDVEAGYTLTVHHLDGDKSNDADWNLAVYVSAAIYRYKTKSFCRSLLCLIIATG